MKMRVIQVMYVQQSTHLGCHEPRDHLQEVEDPAGDSFRSASGHAAVSSSGQGIGTAAAPDLARPVMPGSTPAATSSARAPMASQLHQDPTRMSASSRLEAVLADLDSRNSDAHGALSDGGQLHSRAATPGSQTPSASPTPAAYGVTAGLALGVTPSIASVAAHRPSASGVSDIDDRAAGVMHADRVPDMSAADREAVRQQGQALRRHVAVLHNMQQRETAASMCAACAAIQDLIDSAPDAKQCASSASWSWVLSCVLLRCRAAAKTFA